MHSIFDLTNRHRRGENTPNIEDHCKATSAKYGVEGSEIHRWLDEPCRKYGGGHREFRHDTETVRLAGEIFGSKYGRALAENIALDHIMADHDEEIKNRHAITIQFQDEERPSIPCPYCGTLLTTKNQFCPNCGAARKKIIEEFDRTYELEKIKLQEKRKQLRKELRHEMELGELSLKDKLRLQYLYRQNRKQDVVLDKMIQKELDEHPQIREQIARSTRIKNQIVKAILVIWLIPSLILGVIDLGTVLTWFIGGIAIFIFAGFVLFFAALTRGL